ncbi:MAG TPA: hypothetical protein VK966_08450 [Longimicrobiales bacterium]|nr:hypothetical protein [Longimicrobiales bacterium]
MYSPGFALAVAGLLAFGAVPAHGQDWQTVTSSRQWSGEEALEVDVQYGAGRLALAPGTSRGELYRVGIRFDGDHFTPLTEYQTGRLRVGVEGTSSGINIANGDGGEMNLSLSPEVPLDLSLDFGAVAAELELGGLSVRDLSIETGASDTELSFSAPNRGPCGSLELSMGAAAFEARGLGNVGCAVVEVDGGVGDLTLDFGGDWHQDITAKISMALGSLTLVIPEGIGVRMNRDTFLSGFDGRGLEKRDGTYYSSNWETANHRLDIELSGALGSVNIRWRNQ